MAAIRALVAYGGEGSDSNSETEMDLESATLHLKPINPKDSQSSVSKTICVAAAPATITKVGAKWAIIREIRLWWLCKSNC